MSNRSAAPLTSLDPTIFRRYDIRGKVGDQITPELAYHVGRAVGTRIRRAASRPETARTGAANAAERGRPTPTDANGPSAAVGHDVRHSSPELADATAAGLADAGVHVAHLGQVPTPVVYHAQWHLDLDGCIVVTGSHNPKSDNGLKICIGKLPIWGDDVASLRTQILAGDYESGIPTDPTTSGLVELVDYLPRYADEQVEAFRFEAPPTVAVDAGNGVAGPVVVDVLERLGCTVIPLFVEPDGDFPNHLPDPEVPKYMETLGKAVVERGADCGIGFDGDGDRLGVLDETGRKISADWLIALFARDLLGRHPGGKVRFDVKCSDFLADDIRAHGGEPVMGETGHSLLKRDVKAMDAILGGELSGHILFNREYLPIDDALYCALRFLRLLDEARTKSGRSVLASELFADFPDLVSTAEIKVPCADDRKFDVVERLTATFRDESASTGSTVVDLDGARVSLPSGAWFLIRASNTTPCLTVRLEARDTDDHLARVDTGPLPPN